jgi:hypothetical protein
MRNLPVDAATALRKFAREVIGGRVSFSDPAGAREH